MAYGEDNRRAGNQAEMDRIAERAVGAAVAMECFAPAEGKRLRKEVWEVIEGQRDGRTWRPKRRKAAS